MSIGGMAHAARAVASLPGNLVSCGKVRRVLDAFLWKRPELVDVCVRAIGSEDPAAGPSEEDLDILRSELAEHFGISDFGPTASGDCTSPIRSSLFSAWAKDAGDPGSVAAEWVRSGAPAGITSQPLLAGVFPLAEPGLDDLIDPGDLWVDPDGFANYAGMDEDQDVWDQVQDFTAKGFLKQLGSLEEVRGFVGGAPVLSRFGVVSKMRYGKMERRLISDVKQSR